jgi:uncharacterized protein
VRIEVETLSEAGKPFEHTYGPDEIVLDEDEARLSSEIKVEGSARRKGEEVRVVGKIKGEAEVLCDRCLAPSRLPFEVEFDASFIPRESAAARGENVELLTGDLTLASYEDGAVDVDELVREQILLALPTRRLCREECKGLCPKCGADLNAAECSCEQSETDPRWSALAGWKDKSREP